MSEITELLDSALSHEAAAREARKAAGRILASMRVTMTIAEIEAATGLDAATVRILEEMTAGGRVRSAAA